DYGPAVPDRVRVLPGEDGLGNLKQRVKEANYPWMSANFILDPPQKCDPKTEMLCNALGQRTMFKPRTVVNRGGYKIGIIGATTVAAAKLTRPSFVDGSRFYDMVPIIIAESNLLRIQENCNLVLLLVHEGPHRLISGGYRPDSGILPVFAKLPEGILDAAICGHSHLRVQEKIHGISVIQAGLYAQVVGMMRIQGPNKLVTFEPFIDIPTDGNEPDVTAAMEPYRKKAEKLKEQYAGKSEDVFIKNHYVETALGNMIADAVLEGGKNAANAQFCILNAGGIRNDLPAGDLNYGDLFKVLPFENLVTIVQITGSELRRMLEIGTSGVLGDPPISGLKVEKLSVPPGENGPWDRDLDGNGIKETWERNLIVSITDLQGNSIQDDNTYQLATTDYITSGGDYQSEVFDKIPAERIHVYSELPWRDVVLDFIKSRSPLNPASFYTPETRRIIFVLPNSSK
ncbi:MAG TPA: 5'-nucleotidase C-terminal domain-containing protein, partial [Acidobacteriota bacterium]|nr:5'-nucleotidase C-terminal domain-containing protein [Acidobacteriota bacterium]